MKSEKIYVNLEETFFFDSYAFFEILKGNKDYEIYKKCKIVTSKLNIFEIYLEMLRDINEETARKYLKKYYPFVVDFDSKVIEEAAKLKNKLNKRNISMADCIGYCTALNLEVKFLTGDKEFENLDNVEFVK